MNIRVGKASPALLFTLAAAFAGCSEVDDPLSQGGAALTNSQALACSKLEVTSGKIGSGQSATALATRDQSGSADNWNRYVEFAPRTSATCTFAVPSGGALTSLGLETNYRGPSAAEMRWTFEVYDVAAGSWRLIGDNKFARSWSWSAATLAIDPRGVVDQGKIKVRYQTTSSADSSQLDELVLLATLGGTTTPPPTNPPPTNPPPVNPPANPPPGGIWSPKPGTSWQWQISGAVDTSVNASVFDIDLFDSSTALIDELHGKGRKVVCYFDVAYEPYRPDSSKYTPAVLGKVMDGWPDEKWVDIRSQVIKDIMLARMDLAVTKKCDAVEVDDIEVYANDSGFPLTAADNLVFARAMAAGAHARGLGIALKNDLEQVDDLVGDFDFAVNEECFKYNECNVLKPFIAAGKAVFQVEYGTASTATTICPKANALNFDSLVKKLALDAWRIACR